MGQTQLNNTLNANYLYNYLRWVGMPISITGSIQNMRYKKKTYTGGK